MLSSGADDNQLKNLVLVMLWRKQPDQKILLQRNFHHFCTDAETRKTDSYYVADVFDYHLREEGPRTFRKFHKIYLCGDHGGHFSSQETIFNESTFKTKYNIEVECLFLCSYHAYNLCDGVGVHSKREAEKVNKSGLLLVSAGDYAHQMRNSNYENTKSVAFEKIAQRRHVSQETRGDWKFRRPVTALCRKVPNEKVHPFSVLVLETYQQRPHCFQPQPLPQMEWSRAFSGEQGHCGPCEMLQTHARDFPRKVLGERILASTTCNWDRAVPGDLPSSEKPARHHR
jgi:hypothetical protein